jgi:hypothetical protein
MLTPVQREMLDARKSNFETATKERYKDRKYVDYTLRQYIEKQFDSLSDLLDVLGTLPEDQVKSVLTPKRMTDLLKVVEKSLEIQPPVAIKAVGEEAPLAVRTYQINFGSDLTGLDNAPSRVVVTCPATTEEVEYWGMFRSAAYYLYDNIIENILQYPPKYTSKQFNREILPALNKIANKQGAFCTVHPVDNVGGNAINDLWKEADHLTEATKILTPKKRKRGKEEPK